VGWDILEVHLPLGADNKKAIHHVVSHGQLSLDSRDGGANRGHLFVAQQVTFFEEHDCFPQCNFLKSLSLSGHYPVMPQQRR